MQQVEKQIENKLSHIGAKVVETTEMSYSAQKLCKDLNKTLLDMQTEIAELYELLNSRK